MADPKTIAISGSHHRKEGVTDETVTPGHLLEYGGSNDLQKHSTASGNAGRMFALENDLVGDGIDDDYASGETVQFCIAKPGAKIYAWLAYGEDVSVDDYLESAGDGTLQEHTAIGSDVQVEAVVARATEAVTNTSGGEAVRIEVEVI